MIDAAAVWEAMSPLTRAVLVAALLTALIVFPLALWLGYVLFHTEERTTVETFAPGYRQNDARGSYVGDRIPTPRQNLQPAPHDIPKGTKEVRRISITVKPEAHYTEPVKPGEDGICPTLQCPPVTVDLSLVEEKQGHYRAVASSADGQVISALDIPIFEFGQRHQPNAVHVLWNTNEDVFAAQYSRTLNLTVLGHKPELAGAVLRTPETGTMVLGGIGFRF